MSAQAPIAEAVRDAMYARDHCAQALGITVEAIDIGHATLAMTVRHDMVNGHAICHGGMSYTLADTAFAYACNSRNRRTVAARCEIAYKAPVYEGDRLIADAKEIERNGDKGLYKVEVRLEDGSLIAEFSGHSHCISGKIVEELEEVND